MSSSSEEDIERFREAVDLQFVPRNGKFKDAKPHKPSKRKFREEATNFELNRNLQTLLHERLTAILDKQIKEVECRSNDETPNEPKPRKKKSGIRLFAKSRKITNIVDELPPPTVRRKPAPESESDSEEEQRKFAEVAVTPEWVLQRKGVYADTSRDKPL